MATFPARAWLRALRRAIATAPSRRTTTAIRAGRVELRTALPSTWAGPAACSRRPERIVITSGYVQALALLTACWRRGPVAMEDPGLAFHREVVRRAGGRGGAAGGRRAGRPHRAADARRDVGAVVLTPAHQYPTGVTLHPERRRALTDWARARGGLVIEDDYDGEFRYDRQPVGALQGMAPDHVAYIGTASKTLGPALRLGWMVLPPHLVDPVADAKLHSDHHTEAIGQLTLAELITSHAYDRHVRACRLRYRRRRDLLARPAGRAVRRCAGSRRGCTRWWRWPTRRRSWRGPRRRASRWGVSGSTGTSRARWRRGGRRGWSWGTGRLGSGSTRRHWRCSGGFWRAAEGGPVGEVIGP